MGLSICHGIIAALHGEISVESTVGRGSVFRVALPPARTQPVAKPLPVDAAVRDKRGRVLVVDDEPLVGHILCRILAAAHEVVVLQSARNAVERLETGERFDVILCDLMMPHMTGMDFHKVVAERIPACADRIVFITGGAFSSHARDFLDRVGNERINKPFDATAVRGVVRRFVEPDRRGALSGHM